jgi:hypothetical protein
MKSLLLASLACFFYICAFAQTNNAPVAVDDTVEVMSQVPVMIDALANDYDPDGDDFFINWFSGGLNCEVDTINNRFLVKSGNEMTDAIFRYQIEDTGDPPKVSQKTWVYINLLPNPDVPVAVSDTFDVLELAPVELDVLSNDFDLNGDVFKIAGIESESRCHASINEDSLSITVIPNFYNDGYASFKYYIRESGTPDGYMSEWALVRLNVSYNLDIPVAMPDSAYTTGGIPVTISVLDNDYDPQGEDIEIKDHSSGGAGTVTQSGNSFTFTPFISFAGEGGFSYNVSETADTNIYSHYTPVKVEVAKNPDCPVGVPDHAAGMTWSPITLDVLANDYDVNGDPLEIMDVETSGTADISGNKIIYTSDQLAFPYDSLFYRVRQANDTDYYSEWTSVYIDLSPNPALPVASADYVIAPFALPVIISPLLNDIGNSADSLKILAVSSSTTGRGEKISDSLLSYRSYTNVGDLDSIFYVIADKNDANLIAKGKIFIQLINHHYCDSLTINKINAGVNADGMLFADIGEFPGEGLQSDLKAHFKYPAGAETNTIFNSLPWTGGLKNNDSLCFAGERYRQLGADYQPGPVSNAYDSSFASRYWKLWKLNLSDINYHRNNWWKEGYEPIPDIATWPGNGDEDAGEAPQLAPYFDYNQDGKYDPMVGDYPLIRGDQCIFYMMNDDKEHTESYGERMKIEIQGMAYAFDDPSDSALSHTIFVHYDLINRSENTYNETYMGVFTDFDLGNPYDDYIGSDVMRCSYYCYNGDPDDADLDDGWTKWKGYGSYPPAQSVTILSGPLIDADGSDNPTGNCDFGVNGIKFGNGIQDDERMGMTGFIYFTMSSTIITYDYYYQDYYNLMNGIWRDTTHLYFGGRGHRLTAGSVGPDCNYMFPGNSDPLNFGTGCVTPNPPFDQEGYYWTDSLGGVYGDRRGLGSMGPFTFKPGDVQEIDLAYVVANGWNGPASSVNKLMEYIDSLRYRVSNGEIIVPNDKLGVNEINSHYGKMKIFPNPASDKIHFTLEGDHDRIREFDVYNVFGRNVLSGIINNNDNNLYINVLSSGIYVLIVKTGNDIYSGKFIKQ